MSKPSDFSIVVLISGNGTNLQAIIDATASNTLPVKIKAVVSNNEEAYGLKRAEDANIPADVLLANDLTRREYDLKLIHRIEQYSPDLIVLAGFMRILSDMFLQTFHNRIINIHPSLLPQFPGLNTHALAIKEGVFDHGCTVHFVNENLDAGPIIAQSFVKVKSDDSVQSLKQRVHKAEHFLYPTVINWFAQRRIKLQAGEVVIDNIPMPSRGLRFDLPGI